MAIIGFFPKSAAPEPDVKSVTLTELAAAIKKGEVATIHVKDYQIVADLKDASRISATKEVDSSLTSTLRSFGVTEQELAAVPMTVEPPVDVGWLGSVIWLLPLALISGVLLVDGPKARDGWEGVGQAFSFAKSERARPTSIGPTKSSSMMWREWKRQAGAGRGGRVPAATRAVPHHWALAFPKACCFVGPVPARARRCWRGRSPGEAGVPFFSISGSEFVEMFVGVGRVAVRDLFRAGQEKNSPCIIFIDEIDAVGRQRGSRPRGGP